MIIVNINLTLAIVIGLVVVINCTLIVARSGINNKETKKKLVNPD